MSELYDSLKSFANYTNMQKILIKKIISFYKYLKKSKCKTITDKIDAEQLICDFYQQFSIKENPKNAGLIDFQKKISNGSYGETYHAKNKLKNSVPVITKVQFLFDEDNINEMFISFVIINQLILKYSILERVLVPSYGIFLCSHLYKELDNNAKKTRYQRQLVSICNNKNDSDPNLHIVQQFINGNDLSKMIIIDKK